MPPDDIDAATQAAPAASEPSRTWVRMRDPGTGGEFDVRLDRLEHQLGKGSVEVPGYPRHYSDTARPSKARADLAARPAAPRLRGGEPR